MCIFFDRKIKGRKIKKNAFFGAENEKENEIRSASTYDSDEKWQTMRTPTLLCCFIF